MTLAIIIISLVTIGIFLLINSNKIFNIEYIKNEYNRLCAPKLRKIMPNLFMIAICIFVSFFVIRKVVDVVDTKAVLSEEKENGIVVSEYQTEEYEIYIIDQIQLQKE